MKIFHNPRCSKSRQTLEIIEQAGIEADIVKYLEDTPSKDELQEIIGLLGIEPMELIRKNEKVFKENFKGKHLSADEWIEVMVQNPILIQRPIVVTDNRAVIGRPPESVKQLL